MTDKFYDHHYDEVYKQDFDVSQVPYGWIQWKGTEVCIDLHCACGYHGHLDTDFLYFYECPVCHRKYAMGCNVRMIELTPEQAATIDADRFHSDEPDPDEVRGYGNVVGDN